MAGKGTKIKERSAADRIFGAAVIILSILIFIIIAYPLWFVVIASISNSNLVNQGLVTILPRDIRFYGYEQIIEDDRIWTGYLNTILYVVAGTILNMVVTMPAAYALLTFCYSGAAAVQPAFNTDLFGLRHAGVNYGFLALGMCGGSLLSYLGSQALGLTARHWLAGGCALAGLACVKLVKPLPPACKKRRGV